MFMLFYLHCHHFAKKASNYIYFLYKKAAACRIYFSLIYGRINPTTLRGNNLGFQPLSVLFASTIVMFPFPVQ